jgi:LuxR family maltose regulon positive regulatory protein
VALAAPAGFGKTTVLRQFLSAAEEPVIFAELGAAGTVGAFARGLARALESQAPGTVGALDEIAEAAPDRAERLADVLATALDAYGAIVVLDRLPAELIAQPALRRWFIALVERCEEVRWYVVARAPGELPLASWMAYGFMDAPLGPAELAFTRDEAGAVARAAGLALDDAQVDELCALTGGWPTAFALAMRTPPLSDGSRPRTLGAHRILIDYLNEHVYERLGEHERALLLAASVLPSIEVEVLRHLVEGEVTDLLEKTSRELPLLEAESPGVYRWQPLFRAFLEHALRGRGDDAYRVALLRAGRASESAGDVGAGLRLFVRAAAFDELARLLETRGFALLEQGALEAVSSAVSALLRANHPQTPTLLSLRATFESAAGNFARANVLFQQSLDGVDDRPAYVLLLNRYVLDLIKRNDGPSLDVVRRLLPLLSATDTELPGDLHVAVLGTRSIAHIMLGETAQAQAAIGEALELINAGDNPALQATIYHQASFIAYVAGDAQRAARMAAAASRLALEQGNHHLAVRSFSIRYSIAAGLEDDPERALAFLDEMAASAERAGDRALRLDALAGKLDIAAERGDAAAVARAEREIEACEHGVDVQSTTTLPARALKAAWDGDFRFAYDLLADSAGSQSSVLRRALRWAEVALYAAASGQREAAAEATGNALHDGRSVVLRNVEDRRRFAKTLAYCAVVYLLIGSTSSANGLISELERARREMSPRTRALVEAVRALYLQVEVDNAEATPAALARLDAVGYGGLARLFRTLPMARGEAGSSISFLTRTEIAVLRALARGGSSTKVAAELDRSVNTVNVHVKSIMRKLGCSTRHEAIHVAREHGLIL